MIRFCGQHGVKDLHVMEISCISHNQYRWRHFPLSSYVLFMNQKGLSKDLFPESIENSWLTLLRCILVCGVFLHGNHHHHHHHPHPHPHPHHPHHHHHHHDHVFVSYRCMVVAALHTGLGWNPTLRGQDLGRGVRERPPLQSQKTCLDSKVVLWDLWEGSC